MSQSHSLSGDGHIGSNSPLNILRFSSHPSPGIVSTLYSNWLSSQECSYPYGNSGGDCDWDKNKSGGQRALHFWPSKTSKHYNRTVACLFETESNYSISSRASKISKSFLGAMHTVFWTLHLATSHIGLIQHLWHTHTHMVHPCARTHTNTGAHTYQVIPSWYTINWIIFVH